MANLSKAPQKQLDKARATYKKFKALAEAKGIHYARVYTSFNTRTNQVRVKVYAVGRIKDNMPKVNKLGFELQTGHRFGGCSSLIAHF
ncbi:hypothetical protein D3C75_503350 [compost metagenome]